MEVPAQDVELEEVAQDGEVRVVRAASTLAPLAIEELLQALGTDGRFEIGNLQISEVTSEFVQTPLVVAT